MEADTHTGIGKDDMNLRGVQEVYKIWQGRRLLPKKFFQQRKIRELLLGRNYKN